MASVSAPNDSRIQKALRILEGNQSQTVLDLARRLNLSRSRLSHLFKTETGISVNNYITSQRLQRAAQLLASGEMPIKEITYGLGYHHSSSFIRAFKAQFSVTPKKYRKQQQLQLKQNSSIR